MAEPASLFDAVDEEAEERALREAEADLDAGRVISHDAMRRWLLSWGTDSELPPPECGELFGRLLQGTTCAASGDISTLSILSRLANSLKRY